MAGTIALAPDRRWSAAGWLFDWTLNFLAGNAAEPGVRETLTEIVTANLGWLALDDFDPAAKSELQHLLRTSLVPDATRRFPQNMPGRREALTLLENLAASA